MNNELTALLRRHSGIAVTATVEKSPIWNKKNKIKVVGAGKDIFIFTDHDEPQTVEWFAALAIATMEIGGVQLPQPEGHTYTRRGAVNMATPRQMDSGDKVAMDRAIADHDRAVRELATEIAAEL